VRAAGAASPGAGKALGQVTAQYPFVREEDEERARGRELAGDRSVAVAAFLETSDELLDGRAVNRRVAAARLTSLDEVCQLLEVAPIGGNGVDGRAAPGQVAEEVAHRLG